MPNETQWNDQNIVKWLTFIHKMLQTVEVLQMETQEVESVMENLH
jgi:hypothetical protein